MFRSKPPEPQPQKKTRIPEWLNAGTGVCVIVISIISLITSQQVNFTKLQYDSKVIQQDIAEIKGEIYPRTEAESALKALDNESQSRDRLLEEKINHLKSP